VLHFIIGEAQSGKSEYAERFVSSLQGTTVYIGTLPHLSFCQDTIRRHKLRRPSSWQLIELTGNAEEDMNLISVALVDYRNVLLDGLTFYIFQLMATFDFELTKLRGQTSALVRRLANHVGEVLVVDQPVPGTLPRKTQLALCYVHFLLSRKAHSLTSIKDGSATSINPGDLFYLEQFRKNAISVARRL
jgi:adenosyl cobinamide kinase/adenosyl cobinamide phosphate guanylyltransferase